MVLISLMCHTDSEGLRLAGFFTTGKRKGFSGFMLTSYTVRGDAAIEYTYIGM